MTDSFQKGEGIMGLDFVGSDAHWSYSGFMKFRRRLASEIGINLDEMQGFIEVYENGISRSTIDDDIVPLLNHSDCDGELSAEECETIEPRLRELIAEWDDKEYDKINGILLADGMDRCVSQNVPLRFC